LPKNKWIGDKTKNKFKKTIQGMVKGLSRKIIVYLTDNRAECPNCYYDKVNDRSSGIPKVATGEDYYFATGRCPVCFGKGVQVTRRKRCINGLVVWNPTDAQMNALNFNEAGRTGSTRVQIKTDPCYLELIRDCKKVVLDGIECYLSDPPILRGLGNQAVLVANFFTEDKPKLRSGEFI